MSHSCLVHGKRLGRNGFWNTKNKVRENSIWLMHWLEQKHGDYYSRIAQRILELAQSTSSLLFFLLQQRKGRGEKQKLLRNFLYSQMIYFICWSTISPWQCVAVELQSLENRTVFEPISFPLTLKQVSSSS